MKKLIDDFKAMIDNSQQPTLLKFIIFLVGIILVSNLLSILTVIARIALNAIIVFLLLVWLKKDSDSTPRNKGDK